jgi:hypothetical protein
MTCPNFRLPENTTTLLNPLSGLSRDGGARGKLFRGLATQAAMGTLFVFLDLPVSDFLLRIEQVLKPAHRQALIPQPPMETLDAHSESAFPAKMCINSIFAPRTTPENADWSVPARCRNGSPAVAHAPPRAPPAVYRQLRRLPTRERVG